MAGEVGTWRPLPQSMGRPLVETPALLFGTVRASLPRPAPPTLLGDIACLVVMGGWCLSALSSYRPVSMLAARRHAEIVPGRARPQRRLNVALQITSWFDRGCCRPAIRPLDG